MLFAPPTDPSPGAPKEVVSGSSPTSLGCTECEASSGSRCTPRGSRPHDRSFPTRTQKAAKLYGPWLTVNYRESFGPCVRCDHLQSPVSAQGAKVRSPQGTDAVPRTRHAKQKDLKLGNIDARRDWGFAGDYVEAIWLTLASTTETE